MTDVTAAARRRDIEGLRAVAVVLVVAFHAGVSGFDGGFVGVDVFFALSGYLMTGLLLDERASSGTIGLLAFYARRIRRLLPAAAVATLATLLAGALILDPLSLRRLAGDVVSVATYSANIRFARQGTDYLQSDLGASPLLHHWSLAVEEQFYLVWPILLLLATRAGRQRRVPVVLGALAVTSFALSAGLTHDQRVWSFFGLHTRAWEFAVGGLAAIAGRSLADRWTTTRAVTGWCGLAVIVIATATFDGRIAYPGWRALVPVLGTVLVLDSVVARHGPGALLGRRSLVWLGGRSYAIYLWHWPPLVLVPVAIERPLSTTEAVGVVCAATVVAVVVQYLVEDPLRRAPRLVRRRSPNFAMGLGIMAALLVSSMVVHGSADLIGEGDEAGEPVFVDGRITIEGDAGAIDAPDTDPGDEPGTDTDQPPRPAPSNLTPPLARVSDDRPVIYDSGCHVDIGATEPLDCRIGDGRRTIVLFGDSHAAQWYPALVDIADRNDATLVVMTKSGCPPTSVTVWNESLGRDYSECDTWREAVFDRLTRLGADLVITADLPRPVLRVDGRDVIADDPRHAELWGTGTRETFERLRTIGVDVLHIAPIPRSAGRRPQCVAEHLDDVRKCEVSREDAESQPHLDVEISAARATGIDVVDPTNWVCAATTCPAVIGRYLLYRDASHLTTPFVATLAPLLEPAVVRALDD